MNMFNAVNGYGKRTTKDKTQLTVLITICKKRLNSSVFCLAFDSMVNFDWSRDICQPVHFNLFYSNIYLRKGAEIYIYISRLRWYICIHS